MTSEKGPRRGLGPLGRRMFAAFAVVALASVALLTAAAFVGTDRGVSTARQADRERVAQRAASYSAAAYTAAGGWQHADLGEARSVAAGAAAVLVVRDAEGNVVSVGGGSGAGMRGMGRGMGAGLGPGMGAGLGPGSGGSGRIAAAEVAAGGRLVGSVQLRFPTDTGSTARAIAWEWVAAAAGAALALALGASLWVTRRFTAPVIRVAGTARAIAAGDRSARSRVDAPGELGELSRAFDGMADDVVRAEQARRHLAADVAHELRTPLAALQAGLEELRDGYAEPGPERLAALHDQALRLGRIVGDLAELSEAEAASMSLHPAEVRLDELVRDSVAERDAELRAAGLTVRTDFGRRPLLVRADSDRLHQALGNLLSNAARYCRPGDTVTIRTSAADGTAVVEVADTGPGIPAEDLPHVFERFWRGRGAAERAAGSGIGLSVAKELVAAHGGRIEAASPAEGGTRITIRLPCAGARAGT